MENNESKTPRIICGLRLPMVSKGSNWGVDIRMTFLSGEHLGCLDSVIECVPQLDRMLPLKPAGLSSTQKMWNMLVPCEDQRRCSSGAHASLTTQESDKLLGFPFGRGNWSDSSFSLIAVKFECHEHVHIAPHPQYFTEFYWECSCFILHQLRS